MTERTRSKMEIYSHGSNKFSTLVRASTYELASPRDRDLARPPPKYPILLSPEFSIPFPPTIYNGVGTKDYHRSGSCPSLAPPSHFFFFSFYFISSPDAFYSRSKCATLNFPSLRSKPASGFRARFSTFYERFVSHLLACAKRLGNSGTRRRVASARKCSRIDDGK